MKTPTVGVNKTARAGKMSRRLPALQYFHHTGNLQLGTESMQKEESGVVSFVSILNVSCKRQAILRDYFCSKTSF